MLEIHHLTPLVQNECSKSSGDVNDNIRAIPFIKGEKIYSFLMNVLDCGILFILPLRSVSETRMSTQDPTVMQAAIKKMQWHETRQRILAQNVASAGAPGYQNHELAPLNFNSLLGEVAKQPSLGAVATDPHHISSGAALDSPDKPKIITEKSTFVNEDEEGSSVIGEQLIKMNQNYTDHRLASTIYQKSVDMMKRAIRSQ